MTNYRRIFLTGGSHFFTVNLTDRRSQLLCRAYAPRRAAFRYARTGPPFTIDAIVVLPDHLHTIWTMPAGDSDYPLRWRLIKFAFSRALPATETVSPSRARKGERGIWLGLAAALSVVAITMTTRFACRERFGLVALPSS